MRAWGIKFPGPAPLAQAAPRAVTPAPRRPPSPLRTNRTRHVLHPVLIGHAPPRPAPPRPRPAPPRPAPPRHAQTVCSATPLRAPAALPPPPYEVDTPGPSPRTNRTRPPPRCPADAPTRAGGARRVHDGAVPRAQRTRPRAPQSAPPPPPPSRTNRTRLVPPSVPTGHVSPRPPRRSGVQGRGVARRHDERAGGRCVRPPAPRRAPRTDRTRLVPPPY